MQILKEFQLQDKCSYLEDITSTTHYKIIEDCSIEQCSDLIQRGYRRFGKTYFRPICPQCDECQSIKIDVVNFQFSKSQKRVIKKAKNFTTYIQKPSLSNEHLKLFDKYHLHMKEKKEWEHNKITPQHYYNSFVDGYKDFGYEILYFDNSTLIGVDLIDILQDGISSIYFYYDPDYAKFSLGKLSLLNQIIIAQNNKLEYIYLGYYVKNNISLAYKAEYTPYLTLQNRPSKNENIVWK